MVNFHAILLHNVLVPQNVGVQSVEMHSMRPKLWAHSVGVRSVGAQNLEA